MKRLSLLLGGLLWLTSAAGAQSDARELLNRAIAQSGGREALISFPTLEWRGTAAIHVPNRTIDIAGEWEVQPDSAMVMTHPVNQPNDPRRLILSGTQGWTQRGDAPPAAMPPELLIEERHQFYLYQVLRLAPLLDPGFSLKLADPGALGVSALAISHPDHPDVILYFGPDNRVSALTTVFAAPDMSAPETQEIRFSGSFESQGVRWFREMRILRGGQPYFDLRITDFQASRP